MRGELFRWGETLWNYGDEKRKTLKERKCFDFGKTRRRRKKGDKRNNTQHSECGQACTHSFCWQALFKHVLLLLPNSFYDYFVFLLRYLCIEKKKEEENNVHWRGLQQRVCSVLIWAILFMARLDLPSSLKARSYIAAVPGPCWTDHLASSGDWLAIPVYLQLAFRREFRISIAFCIYVLSIRYVIYIF